MEKIEHKKLNNLIKFEDFGKFDMKVENKPGKKVVENLTHVETFDKFDEAFFKDTKVGNALRKGVGAYTHDEEIERAKKMVMEHPMRRKHYKDLEKEDPNKAKKLLDFYVKFPLDSGTGTIETPVWDEEREEFVPRGRRSHKLLADIGAPTSGY